MRFGLALPHYDFSLPGSSKVSWQQVRDWSQMAEEIGYSSVWMSDHFFLDLSRYGGSDEPQGTLECWTTLAALATTTSRIRIGSLVSCNDFRSPSLVAKMATTVDVLSGGRLHIGIGAGWNEPEYRAAGIRFDRAGLRIERLEESVQILKGMLSEESFSFTGKHYQVTEAINLPQPAQRPHPPIWVGGKGDRIVETAARYADGFNTVWAWTPDAYGDRIRLLEESAIQAGRDPASVRRSVGLYAIIGQDESEIAETFDRYKSATPGALADMSLVNWREDKLAGTPQQITQRVKEFEALGVEEVILGFGLLPFQIADEKAVEQFARGVFPLAGERQGA